MHFNQRLHAETRSFLDHRSRSRVVEQRQHHENCICARDPRFADLPDIDEEILRQDRPVELAPGGGEVVERTTEIGTIAKDAERVRDARISARQCGWIDRLPDRSSRRRGALDFEDEARPILRQRGGEAAPRRLGTSAEQVQRNAIVPARQLLALRRRNLAEHPFSHGLPRRSRRAPAPRRRTPAHRARDTQPP